MVGGIQDRSELSVEVGAQFYTTLSKSITTGIVTGDISNMKPRPSKKIRDYFGVYCPCSLVILTWSLM